MAMLLRPSRGAAPGIVAAVATFWAINGLGDQRAWFATIDPGARVFAAALAVVALGRWRRADVARHKDLA